MGRAPNPCARTRSVDDPYEIWKSADGSWEWRVLKKYSSPKQEASNPYARWYVAVKSPNTFGSWEYGDSYAKDIKEVATKVSG